MELYISVGIHFVGNKIISVSALVHNSIEKFIMTSHITRRKTQQQTTSTNKSVRYSCTTLYSTLVINMQRHNVASDLAFRNLLLLYSTDLTSAGNYVLLKVTAI